jgi:hypothetical protein
MIANHASRGCNLGPFLNSPLNLDFGSLVSMFRFPFFRTRSSIG